MLLRFLGKWPNLLEILKRKSLLDFRFKYFGFLEKKNKRYKTYECKKEIILSNRILFILFK